MNHRKNASSPGRVERLCELDSACVWHPFTPMRQWMDEPCPASVPGRMIVGGDRFELIDAGGRRYIDGFSSLWCNLHGHRVPQIDEAVRAQLDRIAHSTLLGHASPPSIELAERLVRICPEGLARVFYSDSGATAVEVALKMAYQYYRNIGQGARRRFVALRGGYHGDTIGSVSLGGIDAFRRIFHPLLFETTFADSPSRHHGPAGAQSAEAVLRQIDDALGAAPGEYCAVVLEPLIQAAGGMLTHPPGFLRSLRRLTRDRDVLLIADEVATGFCRTGKLFACEHEDVCPDLMCLGKGLTGGYLPVAATLATQEIFDAFCDAPGEAPRASQRSTASQSSTGTRTFYHGHTFTGNALGCAAGVASVDLIFESNLPQALPQKVRLLRAGLADLADNPHVGDIRQCGMMVGIELVRDRGAHEAFDPARRTGAAVCMHARSHGVIIRPLGDVVALMPAPAMDTETLSRLTEAVVTTIDEYFELHAE